MRINFNAPTALRMLPALGCVALLISVHGCSASNGADTGRSGVSKPTGTAGTAAGAGTHSGSGGNGFGDNPGSTGPVPISGSGPAGAAGAAMPPMTPNTALTRDPIAIDECGANNAAGVSAADAQKLKAGSGSPGALKWLYPYDGTVFPRGMLAPDLMWDGPAADVVYIHIKSKLFEYWTCVKPTAPGRFTLPQAVWEKAGQRSTGKDDVYAMELSVLSQGAVTGPAPSKIQIAQAAIKGSIFYNTYRSSLLTGGMPGAPAAGGFPGFPGGGFPGAGGGALGGIVVRIPAAGKAEVFGQTDCNGCHSLSADGSLLLAQSVANGAYAYELAANAATPVPTMAGPSGAFGALYPDGSAFLGMSTVIDVARTVFFGGASGTADAILLDTKNGQAIPNTGIPKGVLMPNFSPDGTRLVFNDYAIDQAHGIATMHYDTKTHTASDYAMLFQEPAGGRRPGWPFMLPDNHGVVFVRTDDGSFTGGGVGVQADIQAAPGGAQFAPYSELFVADADSSSVTLLAKAMGFNTPEDATQNKTYLPFGDEDVHHSYYPTVSPVAAAGYFWVFFDSVRHYGNLGLQRQLWGAAIDISPDGTYKLDPSHPAFYLPGQEAGTGNHRAFAALDPCHKDGDSCTSGIDCCGGFCYVDKPAELVEPVGSCSPRMMTCAKRDERCTTDADCCAPEPNQMPYSCIAGFCAYISGPQ